MEYSLVPCPFCGQCHRVEVSSEEEGIAAAIACCSCRDAKREQKKKIQIEAAKDKIRELFGDEANVNGYEPVNDNKVIGIMNDVVEVIANDVVLSATIAIRGHGKAVISKGGKGQIAVQRSVTKKTKYEIEE